MNEKPFYKKRKFWIIVAIIFVVVIAAFCVYEYISLDCHMSETLYGSGKGDTKITDIVDDFESKMSQISNNSGKYKKQSQKQLIETYKSFCKQFDYSEACNNAANYKGESYYFSGKIEKIISKTDDKCELLIYIDGTPAKAVYAHYSLDNLMTSDVWIKEGNTITVWGKYTGLSNALQKDKPIPGIEINYYEYDL